MIVKAAAGLLVPKEGQPRQYITESEAVDVPETAYYRRRLAEGDLVPAAQTKAKAATAAKE
jgi:hypothetical protein